MKPIGVQLSLRRTVSNIFRFVILICSFSFAGIFAFAAEVQSIPTLPVNDPLQIHSAKIWLRKGDREERCSASIVASNALLTAAHCLVDWLPNDIEIRLSSNSSDRWKDGVLMKAQRFIFPEFIDLELIRILAKNGAKDRFDLSDVGLIILKQNIPSPFRAIAISNTQNPMQGALILTGYGVSFSKTSSGFFHKFSAEPLLEEGVKTEVFLRSIMCSGDSGGGVFEIHGHQIRLAGVNSRGASCSGGEATWLPAGSGEWVRTKLKELSQSEQ